MVTWGTNTVHPIGSPAPAPFGSAPQPAPAGGLFGSTPAAPAPAGGLFVSAAPSPSLFPTSAPSPSGGTTIFGTPSTSTSLFGTAAPASSNSLFGGTSFGATSTFGGAPTMPQQPQIPAQAALQGYIDASNRQEAEKVRLALEALYYTYAGAANPTTGREVETSKFVTITYTELTPEQRQFQWLHGLGTGSNGHLMAPQKPAVVSERDWNAAVVKNPDPENYMPMAMVGAVGLQARVRWQQERAKDVAKNAATLSKNHELLKERCVRVRQDVESMTRRHAALRKRLLDVMRSVELARCMNHQIQPDEVRAIERLRFLQIEVESTRSVLRSLEDKARARPAEVALSNVQAAMPEKDKLLAVFKQQREEISTLTTTIKRDLRDIALIKNRVEKKATVVTPRI